MDFGTKAARAHAGRIASTTLLLAALALITAAASASAAATVVGQWRFDEPSGQLALDDGPFGLTGTLGPTAGVDAEDPFRIAGLTGGALNFGNASFVSVPDARKLDLPTLTVEAAAHANNSPGEFRYLVSHGALGCFAGAYGLYTAANGGLAFYIFDGQRYFVSPAASPTDVWDGRWHTLAGSFDGTKVHAFVDGREVGSGFATPPGTAIEYASMPPGTSFGNYVGACRLPYTADLDTIRIWSGDGAAASAAANPILPPDTSGATGTNEGTAAGGRIAPGAEGTVIKGTPPKASCRLRATPSRIRAKHRARVTVTATEGTRPMRKTRLSVQRAGKPKLLAAPRTNAKGKAKFSIKIAAQGKLRIGVLGRPVCTPAFVAVGR